MYRITLQDQPPYERFKKYLEEGNSIFIDEDMLQREIESLDRKIESKFQQLKTNMFGVRWNKPLQVTKHTIIDYLIDYGIPENYFCKRGKDEAIYYNDDIVKKLVLHGYVNDVMILYKSHASMGKLASTMRNVAFRNRDAERVKSNTRSNLLNIKFDVVPTKNRRFSTANENVIGFYSTVREALSAPEGYYILSCDFPQIDARGFINMYLKNDLTKNLSRQIDDAYLVLKELTRYVQNKYDHKKLSEELKKSHYVDLDALEKKIANFKEEIIPFPTKALRDIYKVVALSTAYFTRGSIIPEENKAIKDLTQVYESSERYKRILAMTRVLFAYNIPIVVQSRWGFKQTILKPDEKSTISSVFNAPIQTTSSEVLSFYVTKMIDYFREKGIGPDGFRICLNRHDEPVFYIKKELFFEHSHFIASMRTLLVEGWAPINLKLFVGNSYKTMLPECEEVLSAIPLETQQAKELSEEYLNMEEPYGLLEPEIYGVASRSFPDGKLRVAFVRYVGPLPEDFSLDADYVDKRKLDVFVAAIKTNETRLTKDLLVEATAALQKNVKDNDNILVLSRLDFNENVLLTNSTVYFRKSESVTQNQIAFAVLTSMFAKSNPELLVDSDHRYLEYLKANMHNLQL